MLPKRRPGAGPPPYKIVISRMRQRAPIPPLRRWAGPPPALRQLYTPLPTSRAVEGPSDRAGRGVKCARVPAPLASHNRCGKPPGAGERHQKKEDRSRLCAGPEEAPASRVAIIDTAARSKQGLCPQLVRHHAGHHGPDLHELQFWALMSL
jgi:hypothetical protein